MFIAALTTGADTVNYQPNVQVALFDLETGDSVATDTTRFTFTSTYEGYAACPDRIAEADWGDDCIEITVSDGDGDPHTNAGVTGTFWMIPTFDFTGFQGKNGPEVWELSRYSCSREGGPC